MGLSQEEEQGRRATNHTPVAPDAGRVSRRRQTFGSSLKPSAHRSQERGHLACWLSGLLLRKHWVGSQPRGWGGGGWMQTGLRPQQDLAQPHWCPSAAGRLPGSSSEQKHCGVPAGLGVAPVWGADR